MGGLGLFIEIKRNIDLTDSHARKRDLPSNASVGDPRGTGGKQPVERDPKYIKPTKKMNPISHPSSLSCSGKPLPGLRACGTGGRHFKPFAVALALGAGIVAGSAQAQTVLDVGGVGVIADETLPAAGNLPVGGTNWSVVGNNGGIKFSGLVSPAATVGASGPVTLTFNHRYNFEATGNPFDGGAVFVSVNDGAFTYVPLASFSANPYVGPTTANAGSTWASGGEDVFFGESAGYATPSLITSVANVGTLTAGDTVRVEFRGGWDAATLNAPPLGKSARSS